MSDTALQAPMCNGFSCLDTICRTAEGELRKFCGRLMGVQTVTGSLLQRRAWEAAVCVRNEACVTSAWHVQHPVPSFLQQSGTSASKSPRAMKFCLGNQNFMA
jgi:hypothetical protein